jgi:hypothetical protein
MICLFSRIFGLPQIQNCVRNKRKQKENKLMAKPHKYFLTLKKDNSLKVRQKHHELNCTLTLIACLNPL